MTLKCKRQLLILSLVGIVLNTPSLVVNFGVSSIHLYLGFFAIIFLYTIFYDFTLAKSSTVFSLSLLLIVYLFVVLLGKDSELIVLANRYIPDNWAILYGKQTYDDFYRSTTISLFQLFNIFVMLVFFNFSFKLKSNIDNEIVNVLLLTLWIQLFVVVVQKFVFNEYRPTGTLGNSQSVGFLLSIIACYVLTYREGLIKYFYIMAIVIAILLTGTRSALGIIVILVLVDLTMLKERFRQLVPFSFFLATIGFSIIVSISPFVRVGILFIINVVTSPLSMHVRFLMWESFYKVIQASPILGSKGITVYFTDNAYWHFILPYGIFGVIFLVSFFCTMIKLTKYRLILYYIAIAYSLQAVSYSGLFLSNLGMALMALLGYEFGIAHRNRQPYFGK